VQRTVSLLIAAAIAWAPTHAGAFMRCDALGWVTPMHCCCPTTGAATDPTLSCCTGPSVTERDTAPAARENAPTVAPAVLVAVLPRSVAPVADVPARPRVVGTEPIGPPLPLRI